MFGVRLYHPGSIALEVGFQPLGQGVEVLGTFLADRTDSPCGLFCERFTATTGGISHATLSSKRLKVFFLDMDFFAYIYPIPTSRQIQAGQYPGFNLFPSILGKEGLGRFRTPLRVR